MNIKKIVATASLALTLAAAGGIVASANVMSEMKVKRFNMTSRVGDADYSDPVEKEMNGDAHFLVYGDIPSVVLVTFRVRNEDFSYATEYIDLGSEQVDEWWYLEYFPGMGIKGETYFLATSMNPNSYGIPYTVVNGDWEP